MLGFVATLASALDFTGKAVVVTGGSRGVGRAIVTRFAAAGAHVLTCSRTEPDPPIAGAAFVAADVRELDGVEAVIAAAVREFGRLDVLVNNAGGSPPADASTASPRFSEAIIRLNLIAPLNLAQRANALMQAQDEGGSIINISSVSGMRPSPGTAVYGAAKAGLLSLTQSLAAEWAPKVRVNAVSAGPVRTEASAQHFGVEAAAVIPMGVLAEPDHVADACLFLASPMAQYVTGANLLVHGGGERPPFAPPAEEPVGGDA